MKGPAMAGPVEPQAGALEAAISEAVSRLYLDNFGKGPRQAQTSINGDIVTTVLRDVFTPAERALLATGRSDSVLTTRMLWQEATAQAFKDAVFGVTGRRVLTVVSGYEVHDEVATEVFVLKAKAE